MQPLIFAGLSAMLLSLGCEGSAPEPLAADGGAGARGTTTTTTSDTPTPTGGGGAGGHRPADCAQSGPEVDISEAPWVYLACGDRDSVVDDSPNLDDLSLYFGGTITDSFDWGLAEPGTDGWQQLPGQKTCSPNRRAGPAEQELAS